MTRDELIEAMAGAIFEAWYKSPQADKEKAVIVTPATWNDAVEGATNYADKVPEMVRVVALARIEAAAALLAIEAQGMAIVERRLVRAVAYEAAENLAKPTDGTATSMLLYQQKVDEINALLKQAISS